MPSSGGQTCARSEEHTSELQSHSHLVCRLLLEKKKHHTASADVQHHYGRQGGGDSANLCSVHVPAPMVLLAHFRPGACVRLRSFFFFFNDPPTPDIYTLPPHDALPI